MCRNLGTRLYIVLCNEHVSVVLLLMSAIINCTNFFSLLQPGRDYEAFFKVSAWGSAEENMLSNKQGAHKSHKPSTEDKPDTNKPDVKLKRLDRQCVKPEKPRNHDIARFRAENSDMAKEASGDGTLSQGVQVMSLEETAQPSQHVRSECLQCTIPKIHV